MRRVLLVACLLAGCAEAIPRSDVPDQPIAFVRQQASEGIIGLDEFSEALRIGRLEPGSYHRSQTTLSLLSVPTGEMRAVPDSGFGTLPLDWSSDGLRLLVGRRQPGGTLGLFAWNRLTGAWTRPGWRTTTSLAAFGDGPIRLAWSAERRIGGRAFEGVLLDLGRDGRVPLRAAAGAYDPDVSSDGRSVLFSRPSELGSRREGLILVAGLGDEEPRVLTRGSQARFSRDGRWIAFVRRRESADVWLMRADGTAKRPIANSSFDEEYPAVSPEGRYVVFASAREADDTSQLYLVRVEDGEQIQLTHTGQNSRPVW